MSLKGERNEILYTSTCRGKRRAAAAETPQDKNSSHASLKGSLQSTHKL